MGPQVWEGLDPYWPTEWKIVTPLLPGHQSAPPPTPPNLEGLTEWVADTIQNHKPRIVLGWSMGSYALLETIFRKGELGLAGVAIVNGSPPPTLSSTPHEVIQRRMDAHFLNPLRIAEPFIQLLAKKGWSPQATGGLREGVLLANEPFLRQVRWDMFLTPFGARIPTFPLPLLVLHGKRDRINPLSQAEWISRNAPHVHLEVLPGAHAPFGHHPQHFVDALVRGLRCLMPPKVLPHSGSGEH